jgi:cytochrome c-type biogenesis protein CcmF
MPSRPIRARGVFILCHPDGLHRWFAGAVRAAGRNTLTAGGLFHPISREGALVLNNLFLTTATATVLVGTLYPLAVEA